MSRFHRGALFALLVCSLAVCWRHQQKWNRSQSQRPFSDSAKQPARQTASPMCPEDNELSLPVPRVAVNRMRHIVIRAPGPDDRRLHYPLTLLIVRGKFVACHLEGNLAALHQRIFGRLFERPGHRRRQSINDINDAPI